MTPMTDQQARGTAPCSAVKDGARGSARQRRTSRRAAAIIAALLPMTAAAALPSAALAGEFQDLGVLEQQVAAFAGAGVGEPGGPALAIDRRLHLARCDGAADIDWVSERRRALSVSCGSPRPWRIFVPLRPIDGAPAAIAATPAAATPDAPPPTAATPVGEAAIVHPAAAPAAAPARTEAARQATVIVAARAIPRGAIISEADVEPAPAAGVMRFPDSLAEAGDAVGLAAQRFIAQGQPVRRSQLAAALAVRRGEPVRIVLRGQGFELTADAVAEEDGAVGQSIRVRNAASGEKRRGTVLSSGKVVL